MRDIFLKWIKSTQINYLALIRNYHFYQEKLEKVEKLVCSIEYKEKYVIHIRALKQALNYGLKLKKVTE